MLAEAVQTCHNAIVFEDASVSTSIYDIQIHKEISTLRNAPRLACNVASCSKLA
jgi:hypothetical protein